MAVFCFPGFCHVPNVLLYTTIFLFCSKAVVGMTFLCHRPKVFWRFVRLLSASAHPACKAIGPPLHANPIPTVAYTPAACKPHSHYSLYSGRCQISILTPIPALLSPSNTALPVKFNVVIEMRVPCVERTKSTSLGRLSHNGWVCLI